jgi:uncharacterized protein YegP (UPF0339 family)
MLYKQVFKNKDGSTGLRYLVTNDETMGGDRFKTLYKIRWSVEVYHESIKQNTAIGMSPAHTERTQSNHVFAAIYAYGKLELAKLNHGYYHFAVKANVTLMFLPAYSPDFNPIEKDWANMKNALRDTAPLCDLLQTAVYDYWR